MARSSGWTTERDVLDRLRKRWDSGEWLTGLARGEPFEPVRMPLSAPKVADLENDFGAVLDWSLAWGRAEGLRVEHKRIGGRRIGSNEVPCRVWVDSFDQLCSLLRTRTEVERLSRLLDMAEAVDPRLGAWVARYPMRTLKLRDEWPGLMAAVEWIRDCPDPAGLYLRQVDAPGVDTKLIESHRGTLAGLLDLVLPADRVDEAQPVSAFAARYGFKTKPDYVRYRILDGTTSGDLTELTVRGDEFNLPGDIETVFIVENEITFLAFPDHPRAAVLLGGGYAVAGAARSAALSDRRVYYWGDIDTHGFAILDRLRAHLPQAESILMDEDTLTAHEAHWANEPSQTKSELRRLSLNETKLYGDLLDGRWGPSIRLEQERIRFSRLTTALNRLTEGCARSDRSKGPEIR